MTVDLQYHRTQTMALNAHKPTALEGKVRGYLPHARPPCPGHTQNTTHIVNSPRHEIHGHCMMHLLPVDGCTHRLVYYRKEMNFRLCLRHYC